MTKIREAQIRETLFVNARVHTMVGSGAAQALLVRGDRIVRAGTESDLRELSVGSLKVVDLEGATVIPGFVDAHCHPLMYGQFSSWVDCGWETAPDVDSVVAALSARVDSGSTTAVRGQGFHHGNVREQRMLSRHDLDRVATDREVMVFHSSGHGAIVNSWVLDSVGVGPETPDPEGGHFGRDANGVPNGEVWDSAADWLTGLLGVKITNHGPNFHMDESPEKLVAHLSAAQRLLHAAGVTTVVDAQVTKRELATYIRLKEQGDLSLRIEMLMISSLLDSLEDLGIAGRLGDDLLAIAGVKLYVDGALTAGTARFEEPYCCRPEDFGYLYHSSTELAELLLRADRLGIQTGTHAQGDAAIQILLDAHEEVRRVSSRVDPRHRIEHFGGPTAEQVLRVKELALWPITQPQYLHRFGDELTRALGDRAERLTPLGEMRDAGVPLVLSSDAPVCPPDPLEAVYSAVTRRTLSGAILGAESQRITVMEALRAHTLGAAESIHREESIGSLESGKLADFVILSDDPTAVEPSGLLGIQILQTYVAGVPVYRRQEEAA